MGIRDLLWACPLCGGANTLRSRGRKEHCSGCAATFRRGKGSLIVAVTRTGERVELPVCNWIDKLPQRQSSPESRTMGPTRVRVRFAGQKQPLRTPRELLGWIERFDPPRTGNLVLSTEALRFRADDRSAAEWRLDHITALQPSSTTLQIKARGQSMASIRFLEDSVRFWEDQIQTALRIAYAAAGKGEIIDFQPHIVVR